MPVSLLTIHRRDQKRLLLDESRNHCSPGLGDAPEVGDLSAGETACSFQTQRRRIAVDET